MRYLRDIAPLCDIYCDICNIVRSSPAFGTKNFSFSGHGPFAAPFCLAYFLEVGLRQLIILGSKQFIAINWGSRTMTINCSGLAVRHHVKNVKLHKINKKIEGLGNCKKNATAESFVLLRLLNLQGEWPNRVYKR